ncbi:hypothetical protein AALP_AA7G227400 [Arabis alpina]|uniref:Uncharacterized protein n=1 Tax=Arabis alpina TaxID=50452 RepID=A0A087GJX2_ARAAL|nr:hypothetical protein AALP_AA7G227400 [Arabis alpina]
MLHARDGHILPTMCEIMANDSSCAMLEARVNLPPLIYKFINKS